MFCSKCESRLVDIIAGAIKSLSDAYKTQEAACFSGFGEGVSDTYIAYKNLIYLNEYNINK